MYASHAYIYSKTFQDMCATSDGLLQLTNLKLRNIRYHVTLPLNVLPSIDTLDP